MPYPCPLFVFCSGCEAATTEDTIYIHDEKTSPSGVNPSTEWGDCTVPPGYNGVGKLISSWSTVGSEFFIDGKAMTGVYNATFSHPE